MKIKNRSNRGQALVEYVLIIALISVVIVAIVKVLGGYLMDSIKKTSCSISGLEYVPGEKAGQGSCQDPEESELGEDEME